MTPLTWFGNPSTWLLIALGWVACSVVVATLMLIAQRFGPVEPDEEERRGEND